MGQKVNPQSFRLPITKKWKSRWFANTQNFSKYLLEDQKIRRKILKTLGAAAMVSKVEIERTQAEIKVFIWTARPGIIIGRGGQGVENLKNILEKEIKSKIKIEISEIKNPELQATLVAQNIAHQLERRISYRKAVKSSIQKTIAAKAKGIKIEVAGRLGGAEISRREKFGKGSVPTSVLRENIDFATVSALTTYGVIGVKVWIYKDTTNLEETNLHE